MPASSALETYPLIIAARKGHEEIVKALLLHAADPNKLVSEGRLACAEGTALVAAAGNGYDSIVGVLLENGADPELLTKCQVSALMAAAEKGHVAVMSSLIKKGAGVNTRNNVNSSALDAAVSGGSAAAVKLLLENGAGKGATEKEFPLMAAIRHSKVEIAEVLANNGADVNAELDFGIDGDPRTPLALAANMENVAMVKMLLSHGALPAKKDKAGKVALDFAKDPGVVKLLGGGK
ncbi:MAG: hypothetical protein A2X31_02765 [Elusimicrobia bacterium GWB2_63_22]|nr:MAG: hypothetical protein A2X31_02765 [Elusimicrobia bacterium GWB2_63_22]